MVCFLQYKTEHNICQVFLLDSKKGKQINCQAIFLDEFEAINSIQLLIKIFKNCTAKHDE